MQIRAILLTLLSISLFSCMDNIGMKPNANVGPNANKDVIFWVYVNANPKMGDAYYIEEFKKYKSNGLQVILVNNTTSDTKALNHLVKLAENEGLQVHTALNLPHMDADELTDVIKQAKKSGTKRAFFFDQATLTEAEYQVIKASNSE